MIWRLPLRFAPLMNVYARMHWSKRAKLKSECLLLLSKQNGRPKEPLPGRPSLWVTRCSSMPCDWDSGYGGKLALDGLVALGWLRGDGPDDCEVIFHWAPARPRCGELVIEVVTAKVLAECEEKAMGWR